MEEDLKLYREKIGAIHYLTDKIREELNSDEVLTSDMLKKLKAEIDKLLVTDF